jgi:hypothetical protein
MLFMLIDFGYKHERGISSRISTPTPTPILQVPTVHCIRAFEVSQCSPHK